MLETERLSLKVLRRDKDALRRLAIAEGEAMTVVVCYLIRTAAKEQGDAKIETLWDLITRVAEEDMKDKLEREMDELKAGSKKWSSQSDKVDREWIEVQKQLKIKEMELKSFKERSEVWKSFLERESVAAIVGSLLLVVLTLSQIIATFFNIATSEIVNNSFLLILGYFFGQTWGKASPCIKE